MFKIAWIFALAALASAQTQIDLRVQSKSADFSGFSSTKPFATGASLPGTCGVGQMFFLSNAPAGQNLYGCTAAPGTWTPQAGGAAGAVEVESAGAPAGASATLNFSGGAGILYAISNAGSSIAIQTSSNTAVTPTLASEQAGTEHLCASASGSAAAFTCALAPTLTGYTTGMVLRWNPDVTPPGGAATLNVDFLGARPVKLADGATDPAPGDITAGRLEPIWFDGSVFRILNQPLPAGALGEAQPACSAAVRGRLWFVAGATGTKDNLSVCAKDAADSLAWRSLY